MFPCVQPLQNTGLQGKDIVTAIIALAALLTSITSLWAGYLRKARLHFTLPDRLAFGYGKDLRLHLRADIAASNLGARPGVVTGMRLKLTRDPVPKEEPNKSIDLYWYEVLETKNIAEKGQPRKLWTDFVAFSSPVVVPKYDAKLIQAGFGTKTNPGFSPGRYHLRLAAFQADSKRPIYSDDRTIELTEAAHQILWRDCVTDATGVRKAHLSLFFEDGVYQFEDGVYQADKSTVQTSKQGEGKPDP